jgi:hypothetical protein
MKFLLIFVVALVGGCTQVDNRPLCTTLAAEQYADYRRFTHDDPPLSPNAINDLIADCLVDLAEASARAGLSLPPARKEPMR